MLKRLVPLVLAACLLPGCGGKNDPDGAGGSGEAVAAGPLKPRMPFPEVELYTLDGDPVSTRELIDGGDAIVFFISLGCETCKALLEVWGPRMDEIPEGVRLFAVADEEPAFAREYVRTHEIPFALYCDDRGIFAREHDMGIYPSVVGTAGGSIAFVGKAVTPVFTPEKALELLADVKAARGES